MERDWQCEEAINDPVEDKGQDREHGESEGAEEEGMPGDHGGEVVISTTESECMSS